MIAPVRILPVCYMLAAASSFALVCQAQEAIQGTDQKAGAVEVESNDKDSSVGLDKNGIRFGKTYASDWQFGLVAKANVDSRGIKALFPLPRNWPEQEVEIVRETKSDNVEKLGHDEPTPWTKQAKFLVRKMGAGQVEQVIYLVRIKKKMILAPAETSEFKVPKKVTGKLRTFLKPSPYIESKDERVLKIADDLRDESLTAWEQVEKNYRWVRENVEYKFDKTIRSCIEALEKKHGDCEELSSLFIAICRCQRIPARAVWIPDHTYPEFYLEDAAGKGHWFPCQAAGTYAFGSMPETRPILQKGDRFKNPNARLPGQPKELRYIEASLVATGGGNLSIHSVRRPVLVVSTPQNVLKPADD